MKIKDILIEKDGMIKGPFGGDIKKAYFVPKSETTYKVYEQSVVYNSDFKQGNYYISEEHFINKLKRFEIQQNDILMTGAGTLGELYEIPKGFERGVINQALIRIRLNKEVITSKFFSYYFRYYIKNIICNINGDSVIPNLPPLSILREVDIDLPDLPTQQKIANVLSAIDQKIELNNKINAELETLAKTIYDYWFVQFEFPDENGKPYKSSGGEIEYNEQLKREIPVEWNNGNLYDIANILMGQSPSGDSYNETGDGIIFFQGRTDFGNRFPTVRMFTTSPSRIAKQGDILLSVRAPVGDINIANEECCIGRGLSALNSKTKHNSYLFYQMQKLKPLFDVYNGSGTTFGAINKDTLHDIKILIPQTDVLNKFEETVSKFDKQIFKNCMENQQLTTLRDWLLPMLMNGQVSVK